MFAPLRQAAARVRAFFKPAGFDRDFEQELESGLCWRVTSPRAGLPESIR
jgi:hypothetical protein